MTVRSGDRCGARAQSLRIDHGRPQGRWSRRGHSPGRVPTIDGFAQKLDARTSRAQTCGAAAAGRRIPDRECAGRGRPCDRHRQRAASGVSQRLNISKAPRAGSSGSANTMARRSSSTTPTSPTRWQRRCRRCGPMRSASWSWCSAPAATAMPASGRLMGAIAAENADSVIVTDDNPRSENPAAIRAAILAAAKGASEIGDRAEAIRTAIAGLQPGDALLIAGKGHETGQIVGDQHFAVQRSRGGRSRACAEGRMSTPLWTSDAMTQAMRAARQRRVAGSDHRHFHRQPHRRRRARPISRSRAMSMTVMTSSTPP